MPQRLRLGLCPALKRIGVILASRLLFLTSSHFIWVIYVRRVVTTCVAVAVYAEAAINLRRIAN